MRGCDAESEECIKIGIRYEHLQYSLSLLQWWMMRCTSDVDRMMTQMNMRMWDEMWEVYYSSYALGVHDEDDMLLSGNEIRYEIRIMTCWGWGGKRGGKCLLCCVISLVVWGVKMRMWDKDEDRLDSIEGMANTARRIRGDMRRIQVGGIEVSGTGISIGGLSEHWRYEMGCGR